MPAEQLGIAGAIFLSFLIVVSILRQRTPNQFQKGLLILSILFLTVSMTSNLLLSLSMAESSFAEYIITAKRFQGSMDIAFALVLGAFVLVTTNPQLDGPKKLLGYLKDNFPSSYIYYCVIMVLSLLAIFLTPGEVQLLGEGRYVLVLPLWFYATMFIAMAATVLYISSKLVGYLRRAKLRLTTARDAYFIAAGVSGYAATEFTFELILPAIYPELRSVGFLLGIALIGLLALAVRQREFLEVLSYNRLENHLPTEASFNLARGLTYLVSHEDRGFKVFVDLVTHGHRGMCITRMPSHRVAQQYGLSRTPILWLSRVVSHGNSVRPTPLEDIALAIAHFLESNPKAAVLLDGVEYLITHNNFFSVLKLIQDVNELVALRESILLIPLDPKALSPKELALITREMASLEAPGTAPPSEAGPIGAA
ncbi:MAG: DUF835 domain-containing protein [Thermoplasmata archaeon]